MQKADFDKRILEIDNFEEIEQRLENANSVEEVDEILKETGLVRNEEEARSFVSFITSKESDEISEEDLENVAGGLSFSDLGKIKKVWEYCKKAFDYGKKFREWVDNF